MSLKTLTSGKTYCVMDRKENFIFYLLKVNTHMNVLALFRWKSFVTSLFICYNILKVLIRVFKI